MIERHRLDYEMLTDPGNTYTASLGLRYTMPDALRALYVERGLDIAKHNGDDSWTLPMPARFVVDASGIVRAVDADPDHTRRPEPDKTLADLAALG